jgi:hypothetical protein
MLRRYFLTTILLCYIITFVNSRCSALYRQQACKAGGVHLLVSIRWGVLRLVAAFALLPSCFRAWRSVRLWRGRVNAARRRRAALGVQARIQRRQLSAARSLAAAAIFDRAAPLVKPRLRWNVRLHPFPLACQPSATDSERPAVAPRLAERAFNLDAISEGSTTTTSMKPVGASTYGGMPVGTLAKTAIDTAAIMHIRFVNG